MRLFGSIAFILGASIAVACSSSGGGGGGVPCDDAGLCGGGQVCQGGFCVDPTPGGGGAGGGGGVGGGVGGGGNLCGAACTKMAAASCPNQGSCVSECETARSNVGSCGSQFDAYVACATTNGTPGCDANGDPELNAGTACDSQESALLGCVQGSGGAPGGGGFGGGGTGGFGGGGFGGGGSGGTGGSDCTNCMQTQCGSQLSACQANSSCMSIIQCAANCTDQTCLDSCVSSYPSGASAFNAFYGCISEMCYIECGG